MIIRLTPVQLLLFFLGVFMFCTTTKAFCADKSAWDNYMNAGEAAYKQGYRYYAEAQNYWYLSVKEAEKWGDGDARLGTSLRKLAGAYVAQGKYAKAEPLYERALAVDEKALGPAHPDVARDLNNLGELLNTWLGKHREAKPFFERAVAIDEKALGSDHPDVARGLRNQALALESGWRDQYNAEAEALLKRALAIDEKALAPDHPNTVNCLTLLAILYKWQGKYNEAEPLFRRLIAITEKALGPNHADLTKADITFTDALRGLAEVYTAQGKYAAAEPLYKRALAISPDNATDLNGLAGLYEKQGKYANAEPLYKRALTIEEHELGHNGAQVAVDLSYLAGLYDKQGKYAKSALLYKRALAIGQYERPDDEFLTTCQKEYAKVLRKIKRTQAGASHLEARARATRAKQN
jgi:tetratricopeptide (TPR) repeat protein